MEIISGEPDWSDVDAEHLRQFFSTPTGQRLLPRVAHFRPPLLAKGDVNEILIRSGEVRAWQSVLESIIFMTRPEPKQPKSASDYPDLLDDKAWNDGHTVQEPNPPQQPTQ